MFYLGFGYLFNWYKMVIFMESHVIFYIHINISYIIMVKSSKPVDCLKNIILKHNIKLIYVFKKQWMYIC